MSNVDVFSPNHLELLSLFGNQVEPFSKSTLEELSNRCLGSGIGPDGQGIIVVRAGEHGCLLMRRDCEAVWIPPYYGAEGMRDGQDKIVDTTGAGNAFLGGLAVGYNETNSWVEACYYGTVAASFVLEQIGVPVLEKVSETGSELWNGEDARARLAVFQGLLEARQTLL